MTIPRRLVVDRSVPGWYHCVSRCVRRAFLCGGDFEHRREWIRRRLMLLADVFAVDVAAYAVMSNHLHVVLHIAPDQAGSWAGEEVARRWLRLFARSTVRTSETVADDAVRRLVADPVRIEVLRSRLSDLSWFMRCLSEPIARRANREDGCTGRFWEGRFKCRRLLDRQAVVACCVYTDLNPIRAGLATTPERSNYTSVRDRIHARQRYEKLRGLRERAPRRAETLIRGLPTDAVPRHAEDGLWLAPMTAPARRAADASDRTAIDLPLDDYLALVDATGRLLRAGKAGAMPAGARPVLERLELDAEAWVRCMQGPGRRFGNAAGSASRLAREAVRRGARWIVSVLNVYRGRCDAVPGAVA